jgi:hypothetical protein
MINGTAPYRATDPHTDANLVVGENVLIKQALNPAASERF